MLHFYLSARQCDYLTVVNSNATGVGGKHSGDVVVSQCLQGYQFSETVTSGLFTCLEDGTWVADIPNAACKGDNF